MEFRNRFIGSRAFYKRLLTITLPIMIQNAITNSVSLLDNLMIGSLGTNAISGVAIANQLLFVFMLVLFGATSGVGIFTAQYYGMKDDEGVRNTFRFKIVMNIFLTIIGIVFFLFMSGLLIGQFLKGEGDPADAAATLDIGQKYIRIMLIGLVPLGLNYAYSGTLRDIGETRVPLISSMIAVLVNLFGNYLLIFGHFGCPELGAEGAAIATVISRYAEFIILAVYTYVNRNKHRFINGAFRHLFIPARLAVKFTLSSLPLMANETLWALGTTFLNQCYSYRSLNAVAALNIESTIWNLMGVAFLAMGDGVGIIIGQTLGSGEVNKAKKDAPKMIAFTIFCGIVFGVIMCALSPLFPEFYNTSPDVRLLATKLIFVYGILMPGFACAHVCYFIIRAGGRTGITMIFDSCFVWCVTVPLAYYFSRYTELPVVSMVVAVQSFEYVKGIIGCIMVKMGIWARNIVAEKPTEG